MMYAGRITDRLGDFVIWK